MPEPSSVILGIDPSTRAAGYGVVRVSGGRLSYVASGCVYADGPDVATRLAAIYRGLRAAVARYAPAAAAVETVFAGANIRTAIVIGEGRGVALLAAAEAGVPVTGYEPATVKRAVTGSGRASKEQVRRMMQTLLALPEPPATDHEADALAIAATHALHRTPTGAPSAGPRRSQTGGARELPDFVLRQLPPGVSPVRRPRRRAR